MSYTLRLVWRLHITSDYDDPKSKVACFENRYNFYVHNFFIWSDLENVYSQAKSDHQQPGTNLSHSPHPGYVHIFGDNFREDLQNVF
jgi:hypothetical protein